MTCDGKWTAVLLAVLAAGCARPQTGTEAAAEVGRGSIADNVYTHEFFHLELTVPDGWELVPSAASGGLTDPGLAVSSGIDDEKQHAIDRVARRTLVLVTAYQVPPVESADAALPSERQGLSPVSERGRPNLVILAEKLSDAEDIDSPSEYLERLQSHADQSVLAYRFEGPPQTGAAIGELDAALLEARTSAGGQRIYTAIVRGYALTAVLSYFHPADLDELETIFAEIEAR
ncbi:MAG: hypothetical protein ACREJB_02390 [Planctomycetaceae bacterium]